MHGLDGLWRIGEHRSRPQLVGEIEAASCELSCEAAVENERAARDLAEERSDARRKSEMDGDRRKTRASLSDLFGRIGDLTAKVLKVIVKADTQGSVEAIVGALREIKSQKVSLEVVHSAVGAITLPIAGFCSSGIFGIEGICTKLK